MEGELLDAQVALRSSDGRGLVHAPVALTPSPFPRVAFDRACELQPLFNELVFQTVREHKLLDDVCAKLADQDAFVRNLYAIFRQHPAVPALFLSVNRSDYMVEDDCIFQIELNTISASLAGLSTKLTELQRARRRSDWNIPENRACYAIGAGIDAAVDAYAQEYEADRSTLAVLFIVQPDERNVHDQQHLQSSIRASVIRRPLDSSDFVVDAQSSRLSVDGHEIAVVYYRAGYAPSDYPTERHWTNRALLEGTRAVKCPDIGAHLAGLKKIQQVLTNRDSLLRVLGDADKANQLATCFAGIYCLDDDEEEGRRNTQMALESPERFVLKPQREGGGNNTYGAAIKDALGAMSPAERSTYILMDRIRPTITSITILRHGMQSTIDAVSELGIYGVILCRQDTSGDSVSVLRNCEAGWLLRTKPAESDEGGVVSGYSVLDTLNLF